MKNKIKVQDSFIGDARNTYCNGCMEDKKIQVKEIVIGRFNISLCKNCLELLKQELEIEFKNDLEESTIGDKEGNRLFVGDTVKIVSDIFNTSKRKVRFPVLNELAVIKEINIHRSLPIKLIIKERELSVLPYDIVKSI